MKSIEINSVVLLAIISLFAVLLYGNQGRHLYWRSLLRCFIHRIGRNRRIVRVGATDMGGGRHLLHGEATSKGDPAKVTAIHGNAIIEVSQILVTGVAGGVRPRNRAGRLSSQNPALSQNRFFLKQSFFGDPTKAYFAS